MTKGKASSKETWSSREELLRVASDRAIDDPVTIRIRDLLALWNNQARGAVVVRTIREELRQAGLQSDPDFSTGYIDNSVRLAHAERQPPGTDEVSEVSLKVNSLEAATAEVLTVTPDDSIAKAQTLMALNNYSQLIVAQSTRSILGAISWESIGRVAMVGSSQTVRQATVRVVEVRQEDDLLPLLPVISGVGFVVVRARDNQLSGIITAADVTEEFDRLASPFFLLGEIERRLRIVVGVFTIEELVSNSGDTPRDIASVDDMSLGKIAHLLESPEAWERIGWRADRVAFNKSLAEIRAVRNRLMHFSPDLPTPQEVIKMRNMLNLLKDTRPVA